MAFSASFDCKFNSSILTWIFLHWACDTAISLHFVYPKCIAHPTSIFMAMLFCIGAVVNWFAFPTMLAFSGPIAMSVDSFVFLSSLCLMWNKAMPRKMKILPFAISFHFVGPALRMYTLYNFFFVARDIPQHGYWWILIGVAVPFQVWFCQNVIRGQLNTIGQVKYDDNLNSKHFRRFSQILCPVLCYVIVPMTMLMMNSTATSMPQKYPECLGNEGHNRFIRILGWPLGAISALWTFYLWTDSHPLDRKTRSPIAHDQ